MATLILTAVGTAVGGPIGGSIGAFIGQQADSAIFGGGTREGPRLKELAVTTSSYGQPLPRHFGRMRVAGTVIWSTELVENSSKQGGGKGQPSTRTYSYSASFAVALSSTPIDRIGRIWADGNLLRGAGGDLKVDGNMRTYLGTGDNMPDPLIEADKGPKAPAFRDCSYVVFEDLQLADFGNRIPALTFEVFALQDDSVSLGQLVPQAMTASSGALLRDARGFADEGGAIGSALSAIDRVFPLNCVTTSQGLHLASASDLPAEIPTLPPQVTDKNSEDANDRPMKRAGRAGSEPLALRYYDEERDYQPGVQRALGLRIAGRETIVDLPMAMTAKGARTIANSNAHRSRWRDQTAIWRIGELDSRIGPGSVVRLPDTTGYWLIRSWEWFDRGIELSLDRLAPELGEVAPSDPGISNAPVDLPQPPTLLTLFEAPADDASYPSNPIIIAATSSAQQGWRGASLFLDQAGTLSSIGTTSERRAVIGAITEPVEPSACALFEPNAALIVELAADDMALESTDLTGIALGENRALLGSEIVQFCHATPLSGKRWQLSGLLRGRAGTEDLAFNGHPIGAEFILLDEGLTTLDAALVPSSKDTRIAAIGRGDDTPVYATLKNTGLSRRPAMPVAPRLEAQSDGSWKLLWTRRARGNWRWSETSEVPLVEEQESYLLGYGPCDAPLILFALEQPRYVLTPAQRTDLIANYGAQDLWVRQVGTFGQSSPLFLTSLG